LQAAFVRLKRMVMGVSSFIGRPGTARRLENQPVTRYYLGELATALGDDLNTSKGLTIVEDALANPAFNQEHRLPLVQHFDEMLGLSLADLTRADLRIRPKAAVITEEEIEAALAQRNEARAAKDFAKSDAIRDDLIARGVDVMDGDPLGWDWRIEV
jgi:cysteinyl-tRNA synthetase